MASGEGGKLISEQNFGFFQLNKRKPPDINCTDQMGNTPLHCAAYRAHKHCALKLLRNGADPKIKNKNGEYQMLPSMLNVKWRHKFSIFCKLCYLLCSIHGKSYSALQASCH